jgi:hypothetical protein
MRADVKHGQVCVNMLQHFTYRHVKTEEYSPKEQ